MPLQIMALSLFPLGLGSGIRVHEQVRFNSSMLDRRTSIYSIFEGHVEIAADPNALCAPGLTSL